MSGGITFKQLPYTNLSKGTGHKREREKVNSGHYVLPASQRAVHTLCWSFIKSVHLYYSVSYCSTSYFNAKSLIKSERKKGKREKDRKKRAERQNKKGDKAEKKKGGGENMRLGQGI
jgi:hypothetical protein